jgi:hypothetical protein
MARHRQRELLKERRLAAGDIQRWYRGCNLRVNRLDELRIMSQTEHARRQMMAIKMQKCVRNFLAYYHNHATRITAWFRGIKGTNSLDSVLTFHRPKVERICSPQKTSE